VSGLETARAAAAAAGGTVEEPVRESAVGPFLVARDPAGHPVHLIDHPWDGDRPAAAPPAVFNIGAAVVDMAEAEAFYTGLGFAVATRDYLPETLVFARQGGTSLVLHPHADRPAEATARRGGLLVLTGPGGFGGVAPAGWRAAVRGLRDPSGNPVRLGRWEDGPPPPAAEAARAAFDRLAALAGRWRVESSKGWSEEVTFELIARGSAVVQRTRFAASPEETMITVFHLDGDRLMLTHYCEARNQPRLVATEVTGDRLVFELLDATSLASRDQGHMDRAVYELGDDGGFTSRWTWYQGGEERWLEEIVHRRVAGGPAGGEGER
jgi:catechol 2,3-dioxygenase-like lactoylglutathione lyase family enzyme